jgi:hypothetical protein
LLYDQLLREAPVPVHDDAELPAPLKGFYVETRKKKLILLDKHQIKTRIEKACILAEELGHFHKTVGDITDQSKIENRKQEKLARTWAYKRLVPLSKIVQASRAGISGRHELAEFLGVTEEFLQAAIDRFKQKYGLYVKYDQYIIYFDPLGVMKSFE